MDFLSKEIEGYIENHSSKENDLLLELNRETWAKVLMPRMLSGHVQGRVLSLLSNLTNPTNIIEIGTYTGYSALCLAEGIKSNGELHTIEINEEHAAIAKRFFEKSKFSKIIKQHIGEAKNIINKIDKNFQLAFIDADKENYSNYFDLVVDNVKPGGWIIADNVLWSGKVLNDTKHNDLETESLKLFNSKVHADNRVTNMLLPIRDGLMILIKN